MVLDVQSVLTIVVLTIVVLMSLQVKALHVVLAAAAAGAADPENAGTVKKVRTICVGSVFD